MTPIEQLSRDSLDMLGQDDAIKIADKHGGFTALVRSAPQTVALGLFCGPLYIQLRMYPDFAIGLLTSIREAERTGVEINVTGTTWHVLIQPRLRGPVPVLYFGVSGPGWENAFLVPIDLLDDFCDAIARKAAQAHMQEKAGEA